MSARIIPLGKMMCLVLLLSMMPPAGVVLATEDTISHEMDQELITLDFQDASLTSVLRSLAYSYNLNLVAPKNIEGTVSFPLTNVTVEEALQVILSINGYTYIKKGNLIYITPSPGVDGVRVTTETVVLNYLNAHDASRLLTDGLSSLGKIRVNEANNTLVVTDYPAYIENLRKTLEELDTPPIQVLIEARLIDITEQDSRNAGFSWTVQSRFFDLGGSGDMAGPSSTLSGGQLKLTSFATKGITATATIDALIRDNKAHLLASPSIMTLSGKEARIIIGERFPYKEKTQTTTGTTETTKFVDIGTTLRVTPWVSPDGWITMYVHPEVSSLTAELEAGPRVATREADATIVVKDGETIVIGGLIKRQEDSIKGKIPILGSIPILGRLFRHRSSDTTSTELVVFITPTIIKYRDSPGNQRPEIPREVFVQIKETGEQVLVHQLWQEAADLEKGRGIISRNKDRRDRMVLALRRYQKIVSIYPQSEKTPEALFRGGNLAYKYFDDLVAAQAMLVELIHEYPESSLIRKAKKLLKQIDKKILSKNRKFMKRRRGA
ncbi:hypothetical protein IID04_00330 [PVC group bacterium]|nr:hypothetical protein [PVC group bacterium]